MLSFGKNSRQFEIPDSDGVEARVVRRGERRLMSDFLTEEPNPEFFDKRINAAKAMGFFRDWCRDNLQLLQTKGFDRSSLRADVLSKMETTRFLSTGQLTVFSSFLDGFFEDVERANSVYGKRRFFGGYDSVAGKELLRDVGFYGDCDLTRGGWKYIDERGFPFDFGMRIVQAGEYTFRLPSVIGFYMEEIDAMRLFSYCALSSTVDAEGIDKLRGGFLGFYRGDSNAIVLINSEGCETLWHEESHYLFNRLYGGLIEFFRRNLGRNPRERGLDFNLGKICMRAMACLTDLQDEMVARLAEFNFTLKQEFDHCEEADIRAVGSELYENLMDLYNGVREDGQLSYSYFKTKGPAKYGCGRVVSYLVEREKRIAGQAAEAATELFSLSDLAADVLMFTPIEFWPDLVRYMKSSGKIKVVGDSWEKIVENSQEKRDKIDVPVVVEELKDLPLFQFWKEKLPSLEFQRVTEGVVDYVMNSSCNNNNDLLIKTALRGFVCAAVFDMVGTRVDSATVYKVVAANLSDLWEADKDRFDRLFCEVWTEKVREFNSLCKQAWRFSFCDMNFQNFWDFLIENGYSLLREEQSEGIDKVPNLLPIFLLEDNAFYRKALESAFLKVLPGGISKENPQETVENGFLYAAIIRVLSMRASNTPGVYLMHEGVYEEVWEVVKSRFPELSKSRFNRLFEDAWKDLYGKVSKIAEMLHGEYEVTFLTAEDTGDFLRANFRKKVVGPRRAVCRV